MGAGGRDRVRKPEGRRSPGPTRHLPQLSTTAVPTVRVGNKGGGDKLVAGYMEEERTGLRKKRHFRLDTVSLGCLAGGGGQECRLDSNPNSSVF